MTHEIRANGEPEGGLNIPWLKPGVRFNPADALRASPVDAPYEFTRDGERSAEADEYDSGQLMIAQLQAEEHAEVFGR